MKKFLLLLAFISCSFPISSYATLDQYAKYQHRIYVINLSQQEQPKVEVLCQKLTTAPPNLQRIAVHRNSRKWQAPDALATQRSFITKQIHEATHVVVLIDEQWGQPDHPHQEDLLRREEQDWVVTQSLEAITQGCLAVNTTFYFVGTLNPEAGTAAIRQQLWLDNAPEIVAFDNVYHKINGITPLLALKLTASAPAAPEASTPIPTTETAFGAGPARPTTTPKGAPQQTPEKKPNRPAITFKQDARGRTQIKIDNKEFDDAVKTVKSWFS